jgi:mono/diheme cytochrome c family protein
MAVLNQPRLRQQRFVAVIAAIALTFDHGACAWAEDAKDVRAGQELALRVCSPCHVAAQPSVPTFAEIARGSHVSPEALGTFLRATHSNVSHPGAMPHIDLTDEQIRLISDYLASLREAK